MSEIQKNGTVRNGPPCHGVTQDSEGRIRECDRRAVAVVESRSKYKCDYGHRWMIPQEDLE